MIGALKRAYAAFRGFDDETGAAPMMDGPLRPNSLLDAAPVALSLAGRRQSHAAARRASLFERLADLAAHAAGKLSRCERPQAFEEPVAFIAAGPADGVAVGLDGRES